MLSQLLLENVWQEFLEYKINSGHLSKRDEKILKVFIENKEYLPIVNKMLSCENFPIPKKKYISKLGSEKKRVVYTFPEGKNFVLKLLTYLLQEKYDYIFPENLYSFRRKRSVRDAVKKLTSYKNIRNMYSYKVDISDYFNSVPVGKITPLLLSTLKEDGDAAEFIISLLNNPLVYDREKLINEENKKGIMAGVPISTFLANLYLADMDKYFEEKGVLYARYSDDIIVFSEDEAEILKASEEIKSYLISKGLCVNPKKEEFMKPMEPWVYLGFCYNNGKVDVSPVSVKKLKDKMRRKARALKRWQARKKLSNEKAAKAFVNAFNRKLYENTEDKEITWARWYFPIINTDESLKLIDEYCQYNIRFLATGRHTKKMYDFRYEDIKKLGYRSLVHEYYKIEEEK